MFFGNFYVFLCNFSFKYFIKLIYLEFSLIINEKLMKFKKTDEGIVKIILIAKFELITIIFLIIFIFF